MTVVRTSIARLRSEVRVNALGPLYVITGNTAVLPADDVAGTYATVELFEANVHASYAGERARLAVDNTVLQLSAGPASDVDSTLVWRETGGAVAESPWGPIHAIVGYDPTIIPDGETVVATHANIAEFEAGVTATHSGQTVRLAQGDQLTIFRAVALYGGGLGWDSEDD